MSLAVCSDVNGSSWRDHVLSGCKTLCGTKVFQLQNFVSFQVPARVYALVSDSDCGRSMCLVNAQAVFARNPAIACNTGVSQALHSCTCAVSGSVSRRRPRARHICNAGGSKRAQPDKCSSRALAHAPPLTSSLSGQRIERGAPGTALVAGVSHALVRSGLPSSWAAYPPAGRPTLQLGVLALCCQLPACLSLQPLEPQGLHQNAFSRVLG